MDTVAGLRLFIRVVETGSFSKASVDLGITQPTATKHVAALEARLGARLFHRSTRGVTPTEVGTWHIHVTLNGQHITGSVFTVRADSHVMMEAVSGPEPML